MLITSLRRTDRCLPKYICKRVQIFVLHLYSVVSTFSGHCISVAYISFYMWWELYDTIAVVETTFRDAWLFNFHRKYGHTLEILVSVLHKSCDKNNSMKLTEKKNKKLSWC